MATFKKTVIKEGKGDAIPVGANVTVEANLYLGPDNGNTAIWSTHQVLPTPSPHLR